jgi:hypothetical protein
MSHRSRRFRTVETEFLRVYSAWQETHELRYATRWRRLFGELVRLKPRYSFRHPFEQAF